MIWLIGNKGMLGTELSLLLEKHNASFIGTDKEIDITDYSQLNEFVSSNSIDWIINCAAYTAVDKAEDDGKNCRLLNAKGAANIASAAKEIDAKLIHISTDYVFDGTASKPYIEDDPTCPIGIYGLTKLEGENFVIKNNPKSYIIRTSWLYGAYGNNFVNTMLRLMNEKDCISVVNDQIGSPTWSYDLSNVILNFIEHSQKRNLPFGIYHFSNEGICAWFDFAKAVYEEGKSLGILSKTCEVKPCTSLEFPAKVKRPAYSVLDKTKIKKSLNITIPEWRDSLKTYLSIIKEQK